MTDIEARRTSFRRGRPGLISPQLLVAAFALELACGSRAPAVTPAATPPVILAGPTAISVAECQAATFTVTAAGSLPLNYQWMRNGIGIIGATQAAFTVPAALLADAGAAYAVMVTNSAGSVASSGAVLTVTDPSPPVSGPVIVVHERADSVATNGEDIVWSAPGYVHATSARCPGIIRSIYEQVHVLPSSLLLIGSQCFWFDGNAGSAGVLAAPLAGGAATSLAHSSFEIGAMTSIAGELIWTDQYGHSIQKVPLTGGPVITWPVAQQGAMGGPGAIASDDQYIYWSDPGPDGQQMSLDRMPRGGGATTTIASGQGGISHIVTDGQDVFWLSVTGASPDLTTTLRKVGRSGGAVRQLDSKATSDSGSLVLDASWIYWTTSLVTTPDQTYGSGSLRRILKDGSAPVEVLAGNLPYVFDVSIDSTFVYWTELDPPFNSGRGRIRRMKKP